MKYILSVDQSTQGTKGLLFDENGILTERADRPHAQLINDRGDVYKRQTQALTLLCNYCRKYIYKALIRTNQTAVYHSLVIAASFGQILRINPLYLCIIYGTLLITGILRPNGQKLDFQMA